MLVSCGHSFGGLMLKRVMDMVIQWLFFPPIPKDVRVDIHFDVLTIITAICFMTVQM